MEGYQPLQLELSASDGGAEAALPGGLAGQVAAARYLAGCFSRLVDVSSPAPAPEAAEPAGAAAAGGAEQAQLASGDSGSSQEGSEGEAEQAPLPGVPPFPAAPASMGVRPPLGGGLLPDADVLAALAAASGDPGSSKPPARPGSAHSRPGSAGAGVPAIDCDDRVLLGAVLAGHLGPLCCEPYVVEAALLPLLDDVAGDLCSSPGQPASSRVCYDEPEGGGQQGAGGGSGGSAGAQPEHRSAAQEAPSPAAALSEAARRPAEGLDLGRQRLAQLLQLLAAVLEPEELSALVTTVCWVSGADARLVGLG